jgi:alginate O-acetyltransferase complex protein AlgI
MLFSSALFLFGFLPAVLLIAHATPRPVQNSVVLIASLLFYAWGEPRHLPLFLASMAFNYGMGLAIDRAGERSRARWLTSGVALNLALLAVFKYADFAANNANRAASWLGVDAVRISAPGLALPLAISFFTFQGISYLVDVYRREIPAQRSPIRFGLFAALFPHLIAGPIVRYRDLAAQLEQRVCTLAGFASGVRRFGFGLAKKMLIANPLGSVADAAFGSSGPPADLAWLGIVSYALQIYFDFSGYSDMAIGLARMLGFEFQENFDDPYAARSMREFWRRWHISLSTWFRDYLYVPLGGNRGPLWRVQLNLIAVFLLCGFWHGASWNFVAWGAAHGFFLTAERLGLEGVLRAAGRPLQHAYVCTVVLFTWILFRADGLRHALRYTANLLGLGTLDLAALPARAYLGAEVCIALLAGAVLCLPWQRIWSDRPGLRSAEPFLLPVRALAILALVVLASAKVAAGTYDPFIYFRF